MTWRDWLCPLGAGLLIAAVMLSGPIGKAVYDATHASDSKWNSVLVQAIRAGRVCSPMECDR